MPELIELCRKNPGKYSYGSAGSGTTLHLSGELFKMLAKVDIQHVPYRGSAPATQDLLAGQIHMMFDNIRARSPSRAPARCGRSASPRPSARRSRPRFRRSPRPCRASTSISWTTLTGPAKLPPDVVERLSELSKKALESDDLKAKFADLAATAWWSTPADTLAYRDSEEARLAPIIKASGARVD